MQLLAFCFFLIFSNVQGEWDVSKEVTEKRTCDTKFLGGYFSLPHEKNCDQFYACKNGTAYLYQCEDGFAYLPFRGCKLTHLVNCVDRPNLQPPKVSKDCPRLYGVFNDPKGCGRFFKCVNGTAIADRCGSGLMFDDVEKGCREPTALEKNQCNEPFLLGCKKGPNGQIDSCSWFKCPVSDILPFGDHSRNPYPGNCHFFIMCFRDGSAKVGSCLPGTAFDIKTYTCEPEETVANCKARGLDLPEFRLIDLKNETVQEESTSPTAA